MQLIFIMIAALLGGVYYYMINKKEKTGSKEQQSKLFAQDFVNIVDVRDRFAYSKNGYVYMYLKTAPIDVSLMSSREQISLTKQLTAELSSDKDILKLICVSRPVDIGPLMNDYNNRYMDSNDPVQKNLLKQEMLNMNDYAFSGDVVERQFFWHLWHKREDGAENTLNKRAYELISKFNSCQIKCDILNEQDIYRLYNLFNNPASINLEDASFDTSIPLMTN